MARIALRSLLCLKPRLFTRMIAFQVTSHERQWNRTLISESRGPVTVYQLFKYSTAGNCCWKCRAINEDAALLCVQCKALQKPKKDVNYFNLFGLKPSFDLDPGTLTKRFRQMQSVLHPDKYANSSEEERVISLEYSSVVNEAYRTLQQPLSRGFYLLQLHGTHLEESSVKADLEFLMDLMARNEEVDDANSATKIKAVIENNKRALDKLVRETSAAFKSGDWERAKESLTKMKYFTSIEAKIKVLKADKGYID